MFYFTCDRSFSGVVCTAMLWTAPELLRLTCRPPEGSQKGDIYSFAIICQEIVHRRGLFWVRNMDQLTPKGRLARLHNSLFIIVVVVIFITNHGR